MKSQSFMLQLMGQKNTKYQVSLEDTALPKNLKKLSSTKFTTSNFSSPPKIRGGVHTLSIGLIIYTNIAYKFLMFQLQSLKRLGFFANKVTLHT